MGMTADETHQRDVILGHMMGRANAQGWKRNGKWTAAGNKAALEFLLGAAIAAEATDQRNLYGSLSFIAFVGGVRGGAEAEAIFERSKAAS